MAVILELSVPPDDLEIGRVLPLSDGESVRLESLVPLGGEIVPFLRVRGVDPRAFESTVRDDPRVDTVERFSRDGDENLLVFDWRLETDPLFDAIDAADGYVLEARGAADAWRFRIRLPDQATVAKFDSMLTDTATTYRVTALYQETSRSAAPRFGLTPAQRDALVSAVEAGYFDVPRNATTAALAEEFGISDQAFIERVRRAVSNLSENTLMVESEG